ncbi:MAG: hypothetical protein EOS00_24210 [Mesorhizobium sp.]|nr:MAG: hypothetical protein EOS00_24210 [Mesorhizobium sp.]
MQDENRSDPSRPPLSCRTSPPQGGRFAVSAPRSFLRRWRLAKTGVTADLPQVGEMSGRTEGALSRRRSKASTVATLEGVARAYFTAPAVMPMIR